MSCPITSICNRAFREAVQVFVYTHTHVCRKSGIHEYQPRVEWFLTRRLSATSRYVTRATSIMKSVTLVTTEFTATVTPAAAQFPALFRPPFSSAERRSGVHDSIASLFVRAVCQGAFRSSAPRLATGR